jgi:hypothetical protein
MVEPAADRARVEAAREVIATLAKAQRDRRTYPKNSAIFARRREELLAKLTELLAATPDLSYQIEPESILFEGQEVHRDPNPRESLSSHLHHHGIREIRFLAGLTEDEIAGFFDALTTPLQENDADDDLPTLFWERGFRHIAWRASDDHPAEAPRAVDPMGTLGAFLVQQREAPAAIAFPSIQRLAGSGPSGVPGDQDTTLTAEDMRALASLVDDDRRRDLTSDVLDVLLQALKGGVEHDEAHELCAILKRLTELSLEARDFRRAAVILRRLVEVAGQAPALLQAIQPVIVHFSKPPQVNRILEILAEGTSYDEKDLLEYLTQLTAPAAAPLTEGFMVITDRKTRKVMCNAIAELVKYDVSVLAGFARDERWYVARNVAHVLGLARAPEGLKTLELLALHPHAKVRAEAVRAAMLAAPAMSRDIVLGALADPDRAVRSHALDLAPAVRDARLTSVLQGMVQDRVFATRDAGEKRAMAIALARLAGERALPVLAKLLGRHPLFQRKVDDARAAAVAGIAAIGTPRAIEALRAAATSEPDLSAVVEKALQEISSPATGERG